MRKLAVAGVVAAALVGTLAPAAQAVQQPNQTVGFYNEEVGGMLDVDCSGNPGPITYQPNGGACQAWTLTSGSQGTLLESAVYPGQCIQAPQEVGEYASMVPCNAYDPTQQWVLEPAGRRVFITQALDRDHVLAATQLQSRIEYQDKTGVPDQLWDMTPAS